MSKSTEPSKKEATDETVTVKKSQLDAILARLDQLETQKADEIEISTELPQAQGLKPGQYVNIAPASQAPDLRKVRWTKADMEKTYQVVEFIPIINVVVAPHGIPWDLHAGDVVKVPSIVRDFHDTEVQRIRHQYDRYRPESLMEIISDIQRSKENPGQPVWGRLHIVGHGFNLGEDQAQVTVPTPAPTETKA
jgi:hypothetical protein